MNDQRRGWIYGLRRKDEPGRYRYVGQTVSRRGVQDRVYHHFWEAKNLFRGLPSQAWIRKHGEENITFDVLEEVNIGDLDSREAFWIKTFRGRGLADLNILDGGTGVPREVFNGSKNPRAKLTESDVADIRREASERYVPATDFATKYGITPAAVSKILWNNTWYDPSYNPEGRVSAGQHNTSSEENLAFNREVSNREVEQMRSAYLRGATPVEVGRNFQKPQTTTNRVLFVKYGDPETLKKCLREKRGREERAEEVRKAAVEEFLSGGESQRQVAARYGVSQTALSKWVRRDRLDL